MKSSKQRVLFFAVSGLGDNLFCYPTLSELEKRYDLTLVVSNISQVALFKALLPGASVIPMPNDKWGSLRLAIEHRGYDFWLYSVGSSFRRPRLLNLFSGVKRRYAFTSLSSQHAWQLEIGFDICLTPDLGQRAWRNNYRLLVLMDPAYLQNIKPWDFYAREARQRILAVIPKPGPRRAVFIHAGCNKYPGGLERYKRWPVDRFLDVAASLQKSGIISNADFLLGPADDDLRIAFKKWGIQHEAFAVSTFDERAHHNDLLKIAHRLLESQLFLGNDSGIAHLSALLKVPTVVVMSAIGQPAYTAPDGEGSLTLDHPVPCQGCTVGISYEMALRFQCPNEWACMQSIGVDDVTAAIENLHKHLPALTSLPYP